MVKLTDLLRLILEAEPSKASQKAHEKGLTSGGYGNWKDGSGKTVARTDPKTGDLVPVNHDEKPGNPAQDMAKPTGTSADQAGVQPDNMPTPDDAQKIAKNPAAPKPVAAEKPGPADDAQGPESGKGGSPMDTIQVNPAYDRMKIEIGRPVDSSYIKEKYAKCATPEVLNVEVIGETVLDVPYDDALKFRHGEGLRTPEEAQSIFQQAQAQAKNRQWYLTKEQNVALLRAQVDWQHGLKRHDVEKLARVNKVINTMCDKMRPTVKTTLPLERGMVLKAADAQQFLKQFHIGETVDDFPPSGFSTNPHISRLFAHPHNQYIGITMRIAPNKQGEVHGLQLSGVSPPPYIPNDLAVDFHAVDYENEEEVIRYSGPKMRTTNVTKMVSHRPQDNSIHVHFIIDLEDEGYDEGLAEAYTPQDDNAIFMKVLNSPVRQSRPMSESLSYLMREWDDDSPAAQQAHTLGLIHKGHGWWMDKTGKVVARTINGQLVKVLGDEPPVKPTFKTTPAAEKPKGMPKAATDVPPHKQKGHGDSQQTSFMSKWGGLFGGGGGKEPPSHGVSTGGYGPSDDKNKKHHGKPVYKSPNELSWTVDEFPAELTELSGIPLKPWKDAPKDVQGWQKVEGQNPAMNEPPLPPKKYPGDKFGAGVIIMEPTKTPEGDFKVWIVEPFNHFGGYEHTFPKGTQDEGLNLQQTAIKEAYEESGLKVELLSCLGDFQRSTSIARYYIAKRVGGTPLDHGWESHAVKLVSANELPKYFNMQSDKRVARNLFKKLGIKWPPKEGELTGDQIMHQKVGGQKGTNSGAFYKGTDGKMRYVKQPKNPTQAWVENICSALYRELHIPAAPTQVFDHDGKMMLSSEIVPGKQIGNDVTSKRADKIVDGFGADVLMMNWDALGLAGENVMVDGDNVYRIDPGGSLMFRAQGAPKTSVVPDEALDDASIEWSSLITKGQYGKVFSILGLKNADELGMRIVKQLDAIKSLEKQYGGWADFVDEHAPGMDEPSRQRAIQMLDKRSQWLYKKADEIWAKQNKNKPQGKDQGEFYYDPNQLNGMGKPKKVYGKDPNAPKTSDEIKPNDWNKS